MASSGRKGNKPQSKQGSKSIYPDGSEPEKFAFYPPEVLKIIRTPRESHLL